MTWFKVDDKLNGHPKVLQLGEDGDSDAMALWVLAGSWAAEHETDGWVSVAGARRVDPEHYERRAAALVRVRLWEEAERDGKKGWIFHGWNEPGRQPTKQQIQAARSSKSARQARWREGSRSKMDGPDDDRVDGVVDASTRFDVDAGAGGDTPEGALAQVLQFPTGEQGGRLQGGAETTFWGDGLAEAYGQQPVALFPVDGYVDASTPASVDGVVGAFPTRPDPTNTTTSSSAPATPETDADRSKPKPAKTKSAKAKALDGERPDVERLCNHLADRIAEDGSKRPEIGDRWRDAARLMLDNDGLTEEQVHKAIDWCQDHHFWSSNILSMPKLRAKYTTLRKQARAQVPGQRRGAYVESDDRAYGPLASAFESSGA
jgi:hypothetical protein